MSETVQSGPGGGPTEVSGAPTAAGEQQSRSAAWTAQRVVIAALVALLVVWLAIKAADNFSQFVTVTLNGLSLSALLLVLILTATCSGSSSFGSDLRGSGSCFWWVSHASIRRSWWRL